MPEVEAQMDRESGKRQDVPGVMWDDGPAEVAFELNVATDEPNGWRVAKGHIVLSRFSQKL